MSLVLWLSIHGKSTRVQAHATVKHWGHRFSFCWKLCCCCTFKIWNCTSAWKHRIKPWYIHFSVLQVQSVASFASYAERMPGRGTESCIIRLNVIPVCLPVLDCKIYSFPLRWASVNRFSPQEFLLKMCWFTELHLSSQDISIPT